MTHILNFLLKLLGKDYRKALMVGLNILTAIDGFLEEAEECTGNEIELFPIYVKRGGKKWTINVTLTCSEKK